MGKTLTGMLATEDLEKCSTSLGIREMQIKPMKNYCYVPVRMGRVKIEMTSNVGKDEEQTDCSHIDGGDGSGLAILENTLEASSKTKHANTTQSRNGFCGHLSQSNKSLSLYQNIYKRLS